MREPPHALSISGLSKTFSGQRVLDNVDLMLRPGEIRALVGQNGCGKSTLIKVLAGYHTADTGAQVAVNGEPLHLSRAGAGEAAGLRFVHQDLGLVLTLDTVDNLALGSGYERNRVGLIRWRREIAAARRALADLGYDIDVRTATRHLAMSERTGLALARALSQRKARPSVLVLDEPTASLPAAEIVRLFDVVRAISASGVAVLFVSHHLDEVFSVCHTVTVLRDGKHIATRDVAELNEASLVELMIGRTLEAVTQPVTDTAPRGPVVLDVNNLQGSSLAGIDLSLRSGEVVGVAGITGSGRDTLLLSIFGGVPRSGTVTVNGSTLPQLRPDVAVAAGVGLVPSERHANAAFLDAPLRENISIVNPRAYLAGGILRRKRETSDVTRWLKLLRVEPPAPERAMSTLSGGNQQKVVLARWLRQEPKVLLLDEPTQGVDVGAKSDIHALIEQAASDGTALLIASTDHVELTRLAERVLVLRGGRVAEEIRRPHINPDRITAATIGATGVVA